MKDTSVPAWVQRGPPKPLNSLKDTIDPLDKWPWIRHVVAIRVMKAALKGHPAIRSIRGTSYIGLGQTPHHAVYHDFCTALTQQILELGGIDPST